MFYLFYHDDLSFRNISQHFHHCDGNGKTHDVLLHAVEEHNLELKDIQHQNIHFHSHLVPYCASNQKSSTYCSMQRKWVFATNSDVIIPILLQANVGDISYLKLWILLNIKGLHHLVAKMWDLNFSVCGKISIPLNLNSNTQILLCLKT